MGAYYAKYISRAEEAKPPRITRVAYDSAVAVDTYWDLGIGDTTAIWFIQPIFREYHVIDHLEMSGVGLDWYVKQLKDKEYIFNNHYLPHDAAARELGTGKTRQEQLRDYKLGRTYILEKHNVDDGINAVRMILDKCWFDKEKCKRGLDSLRAYSKKWDAKNKIMSDAPLHNWASHSADAFRTFAMGNKGLGRRVEDKNLQRIAETDYDMFNISRED